LIYNCCSEKRKGIVEMVDRHLVTGWTGFTGAKLAMRLFREGKEVIVLDITRGYGDELEKMGIKVIIGSVNDAKLVDQLMSGVSYVHHVAAAFRQIKLPKKEYWDANVESNRVLLEAAKKHGIKRYLLTSTTGVHGNVKTIPAGENAPIHPEDYYQYTKYEGEKLAKELCEHYDIPFVVIRPGGIYGPYDWRFLRLFKAIKSGKFFMMGRGEVYNHLAYIDNLVDGYLLCTEKEEALGQTYIIADDKPVTLNELVKVIAESLDAPVPKWHFPIWPVWTAGLFCELICKPFGIEPPLFRRRVDFFKNTRVFDISKAKKELGYEPKIDLKTGVKLTAEWYKERDYL
jgi:nucleoside-diphosphate-sugar epimerase